MSGAPAQIFLVDDEANIRRMLGALLRDEGFTVAEAPNGNAALLQVDAVDPDVIVLDLMMPPGPDGLETLTRLRERGRATPVIMMSGKAQLTDAVRAVKLGAFQFLEKPLTPEAVLVTVRAALELNRARAENRTLLAELARRATLIGESPAIRQVRALVERVGPTDARVLVTGESGTGKELVAGAVHAASRRAARPFVTVNCAAIPRDLVESEMFGHERGSFTGATERRMGRFELAHGGTLFLDEIGDLSAEAQAKLLRTLETGELQRIGSEGTVRVDVRVVSATNRRLHEEVDGGDFREDLFFRLNVFPIHLPALRERLEDLPALVAYLAERVRPRHAASFTPAALEALAAYPWPGNVRELANLVERLSILSGPTVDAGAVRQVLRSGPPGSGPAVVLGRPLSEALDDYERALIAAALAQAEGNVAEAARVLQTDRANLYRRIRRLGLESPKP
ncbi:MAG: sigma-54-dependent Fis family transcriptional regulator [Gemmatimonadales bacterium]|nr:sigma-54-dependent Fis family transcriptional regulator [Gemmatimonadales bacterium]MBA3554018.1 sigma-54-dependent Fis family transcriptional regulator [Gemmatimonadales bacterium]